MENAEVQSLYDNYHRRIAKISLSFKRYLYSRINWDARMVGIKGARGVGKTTMLLQHILENYDNIDQTLYASLDDLWFASHSLIELVDWAYGHGINRLYLDEVHRYKSWSENLKNIYDNYPDMSIVYTSSSMLAMDNAKIDLSRRQTIYTLYGLSFREFLALDKQISFEPVSIEALLRDHISLAMQITKDLKDFKIISLFESYLQHGYYPFYLEARDDFLLYLREIVSVVIESDLSAVESVSYETIQKVKRLLMIVSEHVPFEPNMSELWQQLATNNELGMRMLYALDRAQILSLLTAKAKSYKSLCKPDKIFLDNTNLMYALCPKVDMGNARETFFQNQVGVVHEVNTPQKGDFIVDNRYLFEVGGRNKGFDQIKDLPDSFLAVDQTEVGYSNRIPLWMFGMMY